MRKAFDYAISENEKYLCITEKTHQDQLLLLLGYFSVIGVVKILLRSQVFAEISNLKKKKQAIFAFFFPLKLGSESTKQYSAAVRKYRVPDTCLKIAVVEKHVHLSLSGSQGVQLLSLSHPSYLPLFVDD